VTEGTAIISPSSQLAVSGPVVTIETGVGDRGGGEARAPKIPEKKFSGNYVKSAHFWGKYHVKSVNFNFLGKCHKN